VSPQRSNRAALIEGTLRCLERLPPERVTARAIAEESGANLASIAYHFGSKENLVTEAVIEGLDRWLAEIADELDDAAAGTADPPAVRFQRAGEAMAAGLGRRAGLARTFVGALVMAQHDDRVREKLAAGFHRSRADVAAVLGLGDDRAGLDAAGLVLALFNGLLFQSLLDPALAIEGERMVYAQARLRDVLPRPRPAGGDVQP
jgi:AcrR family transcriptional regulator